MDFAPYQDTDPERTRALSPPPPTNRALSPNSRTAATRSPPPPSQQPQRNQTRSPFQSSSLPAPSYYNDNDNVYDNDDERFSRGGGGGGRGGRGDIEGRAGGGGGGGIVDVNLFETSLPLRLDYEAMLAYLLLPPVGGVVLLIVEHKSDYVRFHAWQSALVFTAVLVIHLIFSWSTIFSWIIFVCDLLLIAALAFRAYRDADGLDRFEVPFFGGLASSFVDSE